MRTRRGSGADIADLRRSATHNSASRRSTTGLYSLSLSERGTAACPDSANRSAEPNTPRQRSGQPNLSKVLPTTQRDRQRLPLVTSHSWRPESGVACSSRCSDMLVSNAVSNGDELWQQRATFRDKRGHEDWASGQQKRRCYRENEVRCPMSFNQQSTTPKCTPIRTTRGDRRRQEAASRILETWRPD